MTGKTCDIQLRSRIIIGAHALRTTFFLKKEEVMITEKMLLTLILLLPLATADYYKETQDFQYSRNDDKGQKTGFYAAQTGNMGGNYEKAFNMDNMAERQLHNLKEQVGSQLGIDALAIGSGHLPNTMGSGSIYGSASTSGKSVQNANEHNSGSSSRLGVDYSAARGSSSNEGRSSSQFSNYDNFDSNKYQAAAVQNAGANIHRTSSHYGSGSTYSGSNAEVLGESGRRHDDRYISGATGGRYNSGNAYGEHGYSSARESQNAESRSQSSSSSSNYQKTFGTYGVTESQNSGTSLHSVPMGSNLKITGRPGETIRIPIRVVAQPGDINNLQSGYVQSTSYDANSQRQNLHSDSQLRHTGNREIDVSHDNVGVSGSTADNEQVGGGRGRTYQSSYSYKKEWESRGSTARQPIISTNWDSTTDVNIARDKLVSVGGDNYESSKSYDTSRISYGTNYHPGRKNLGHTGSANLYVAANNDYSRQSGHNQEKAQENAYQGSSFSQQRGETSKWSGNAESTRTQGLSSVHGAVGTSDASYNYGSRVTGHNSQAYGQSSDNYDQHTNAYRTTENKERAGISSSNNLNTNDDSTYQTVGQPKSYSSSYSYHKSWEKHGTPYVIQPGTLDAEATAGGTNYAANSGSQSQGSSWSSGQQRSAYSGGASYGQSQKVSQGMQHEAGGSMQDNLEQLQQQLRSKMNEMCTTCGSGNTKGYSASYSYSAQRSYGGNHDSNRKKRRVTESELNELDEYDNISIRNKISEYEKWHDQVKELRQRVKALKQSLDNEQGKETTTESSYKNKYSSNTNINYNNRKLKGDVEEIDLIDENKETQREIKDINDLKDKITTLRSKVQKLAGTLREENDLKKQIDTVANRIKDFDDAISKSISDKNKRKTRDTKLEEFTLVRSRRAKNVDQSILDMGQQTEDFRSDNYYLGQETEDLRHGELYIGQQTQDLRQGELYVGQQTQNLQQGELYVGQQTQNQQQGELYVGQQTQDLKHGDLFLGQQNQDLTGDSFYTGQQTDNSERRSFRTGQETHQRRNENGVQVQSSNQNSLFLNSNSNKENKEEPQTFHSQSESNRTSFRPQSHTYNGNFGNEDELMTHLRELQKEVNTNNGVRTNNLNAHTTLKPTTGPHRGDVSVERSFLDTYAGERTTKRPILSSQGQHVNFARENHDAGQQTMSWDGFNSKLETPNGGFHYGQESYDAGQQTMAWDGVQPEVETSNSRGNLQVGQLNTDAGQQTMDWNKLGLENSHLQYQNSRNLQYGKVEYDQGQLTQKTEDLNILPVQNENAVRRTQELNNPHVFEHNVVNPTTTEKPGFWKSVGNKAKSIFG